MPHNKYIKPGLNLFNEQKEFISKMVRRRRCILSGKVGSGKTLTTLYSFSFLKANGRLKNMVVLTPLSAYEKDVWKKDAQKFTTLRCISLDEFVKRSNSDKAIDHLLNTYDIIYGKHTHVKVDTVFACLSRVLSRPDVCLCIDEVHAFRNPKTDQTLALRALSRNVFAFWGITGTTISRNIENLYNIVNLIYPWYLGPWVLFRDTYCNTETKTVSYVRGRRKQVTEVTSLKDPEGLQAKLEPIFIQGSSFLEVNYHWVDYVLQPYEQGIYSKIARGITLNADAAPDDWFKTIMSQEPVDAPKHIGKVDQYSSRFIYLQFAADGVISPNGDYTRTDSTKLSLLRSLCEGIAAKGQSAIVYFDYLAPLEIAQKILQASIPGVKILLSTGNNVLKDTDVTEGKCKQHPHIILCTRAASESVSYYFINNVIFFHSPTVPSTMIQLLGRITRKNTLYPDDLNCYIFRSKNIDLYKHSICAMKTKLMEDASGEHEANCPDDYKQIMSQSEAQTHAKRILLWQK